MPSVSHATPVEPWYVEQIYELNRQKQIDYFSGRRQKAKKGIQIFIMLVGVLFLVQISYAIVKNNPKRTRCCVFGPSSTLLRSGC